MAEKNFSLVVELQADIDKFVKNMDRAKGKNKDFGNNTKKFNDSASKGFGKTQGTVVGLGNSLSGLGGTAGMLTGQFTDMFSQIGKGGGKGALVMAAVAAAVALISNAVKESRREMDEYSKSLNTIKDGYAGFTRAAKDAWKAERDIQKGRRKQATRGMFRVTTSAEGEQLAATRKEAREQLKLIRGQKDKHDWQDDYNTLLQQELDLKMILLDKEVEWKKLDAERANAKRIAMQTDADAAVRQEALNKYTLLTNAILADKTKIYSEQQEIQEEMFNYASSTYDDAVKLKAIEAKMYDIRVQANNELAESDEKQRSITAQVAKELKDREAIAKAAAAAALVEAAEYDTKDWMTEKFSEGFEPKLDKPESDWITNAFNAKMNILSERMQVDLDNMKAQMEEGLDEIQTLIQDSIAGMVGTIAEGIGSALVSGDWESMFDNVLSAVGEFMSQMGALFISFGVGSQAFQALLGNISNPAAAIGLIGAGAALMVIGGAIKATASSYGGGGSAYNGGGAAASAQQQNDFTVKFEIEGDKLVGVTENYNRKKSNYR